MVNDVRKRFKSLDNKQNKSPPLKAMLSLSPKELRSKLGLTQADFWRPVGVSQSGGSRYESGRKLPISTNVLLYLVHIHGIDITRLNGDEVLVGQYLSHNNTALFEKLLAEASKANVIS